VGEEPGVESRFLSHSARILATILSHVSSPLQYTLMNTSILS